LTAAATSAAIAIDHTSQHFKQPGNSLNFIEDQQLILMAFQKQLRFLQLGPICRRLKIQDEAGAPLSNLVREGGFTHLSWPQQRNGREAIQCLQKGPLKTPGDQSGRSIHANQELCSSIAGINAVKWMVELTR
jgi:hypothetical protein